MGHVEIAIVISAVLTLAISIAVWRRFSRPDPEEVARALRLRETLPFEAATQDGAAKVEGRVAAGSALLTGPISGKEAVWLQIEVTEDRSDEAFTTLFSIDESVPFKVGDVEVIPTGMLPKQITTASSGPVVEASPAMNALMAKHGKSLASADGFTRRRDFIERTLRVGERVLLTGRKRATKMKAGSSNYRDGALATETELEIEWVFVGDEAEIARRGRRAPFGHGDAIAIGITWVIIGPLVGTVIVRVVSLIFGD